MIARIVVGILFAAFAAGPALGDVAPPKAHGPQRSSSSAATQKPPFSYPEDPKNGWGGVCAESPPPQQSPIAFSGPYPRKQVSVQVIPPGTFDPHDNNVVFATQVHMQPDPGTGKNAAYTILGMHFHNPREHVLPVGSTKLDDVEAHFKAWTPAGIAVFGVTFTFANEGRYQLGDAFFESVSNQLNGDSARDNTSSILEQFAKQPFYTYVGSLTTPPCDAPIRWYVLEKPVPYGIVKFWTTLYTQLQRRNMPASNNRLPKNGISPPDVTSIDPVAP